MTEKIYLDTFVFMDVLSNDPQNATAAGTYLNKLKAGTPAVISSVLFSELAFHIRRKKGKEKVEEILMYIQSLPNLEIMPVTVEIAKAAGMLRARYHGKIEKKLTYFDCIHLATALDCGCTRFVTGDKGFRDIREIKMEIY
ncbi:MAG TPA: PIN domain-containing protein [archaeon]|nr:PIN domain-containing protein [archaeon]